MGKGILGTNKYNTLLYILAAVFIIISIILFMTANKTKNKTLMNTIAIICMVIGIVSVSLTP
jgi:hypothetical protein